MGGAAIRINATITDMRRLTITASMATITQETPRTAAVIRFNAPTIMDTSHHRILHVGMATKRVPMSAVTRNSARRMVDIGLNQTARVIMATPMLPMVAATRLRAP